MNRDDIRAQTHNESVTGYPLSTNDFTKELLEHDGQHRDAAIEDENYYIMHEYNNRTIQMGFRMKM